MKKQNCRACSFNKCCRDSAVSWIFFGIGIISALAVRLVAILDYHSPVYGRIAWYIGGAGFTLFFLYKFKASSSRARIIREYGLMDNVDAKRSLSERQAAFIRQILCNASSRKERINFFFIFILSVLAIAAAIYFDFFR